MSENHVSNKLKTKVEGRELTMERVFHAPRELVFKAFSDPEHLSNWWGPKGWETTIRTFEFKPDGLWHYCMRCADKNQGDFYGQESWSRAVFHEIVVPEKIVYTDSFSDEEGNTSDSMPSNLVTMTFVEDHEKTKIITRSKFESSEALQRIVDMGMVQGFRQMFDRLDDYLEEIQ